MQTKISTLIDSLLSSGDVAAFFLAHVTIPIICTSFKIVNEAHLNGIEGENVGNKKVMKVDPMIATIPSMPHTYLENYNHKY